VAWGAFSAQKLFEAGAEEVLSRPSELVSYIARRRIA
jgi:hypothetical protein